jgi:hypothetical protein
VVAHTIEDIDHCKIPFNASLGGHRAQGLESGRDHVRSDMWTLSTIGGFVGAVHYISHSCAG